MNDVQEQKYSLLEEGTDQTLDLVIEEETALKSNRKTRDVWQISATFLLAE